MPFQMTLWRVAGSKLENIGTSRLDQEQRLEDWIAADPSILGMDDIVIIGRQVCTDFSGRIDLLAMNREANCTVLELKKGRTPREVTAQTLEYGAWVNTLDYDALDEICLGFHKKDLRSVFKDAFDVPIPEVVNASHNLVVVASELDESSERIIAYLSEVHRLSINAVFFGFFADGNGEYLGRAWLKDPVEIVERAESRKRAPWGGFWFVNLGEGEHRNWDDNRKYGYIGAGQGEKYSRPLTRLKVGDKIFAYMKGRGYVGYGEVTKEAVPAKDFRVDSMATPLLDLPLKAPHADENKNSDELSEWAVGVKWLRAYPREEAKTFSGVFANQNIVCKLRDLKTLDFLRVEFGAS
jgi:hypothetical protein